jgi:hypothetical protein
VLAYANDANQAINCQKHQSISLNLQRLLFDTERYQSVSSGTSMQHYLPYRLSIRHHGRFSRDETMLEHILDRKEVVSVTGDTTSANIEDSIDRRIKEMHQHEYWRASTNIEARIQILE